MLISPLLPYCEVYAAAGAISSTFFRAKSFAISTSTSPALVSCARWPVGGVDGEEEGYVVRAAVGPFEGPGSFSVSRVLGVGGVLLPGDFGVHEGLVGGGTCAFALDP